ncbi:MAG: PAS domain-containing protein, partial [bacterium]
SSDYLWDVYNTVNAGIFVLDLDGRIKTMNRRFRSLIGVQASELEGASVEEIFSSRDEIDFETINRMARNDRFFLHEATVTPLMGDPVPVLLSLRSLMTTEGNCQGILCMALEQENPEAVQEDLLSFYSASTTFQGLLKPDGSLISV